MTADTASGIGYAPRLSFGRRIMSGTVGPVLVVCAFIVAIWYVFIFLSPV